VVGDAANEIQRVDRQLGDVEEEIKQLQEQKAVEVERRLNRIDPEVLKNDIYEQNQLKAKDAPPIEQVHITEPQDYEIFKETAKKFEQIESAMRKEIRKRKVLTYHRMRMTAERMAKVYEVSKEAGEALRQQQQQQQNDFGEVSVLEPGALFRLRELAAPQTRSQESRWDSSLAPEVEMVWRKDVIGLRYDDQTSRVLDSYRENEERRATLKWTDEEQNAFIEAYKDYGKEFHVIATKKPFRVSEVAPKTTHDIISFYYHIKHRIGLKQLVSRRGGMRSIPQRNEGILPANTPIPREFLALGITTEKELLAYLVAQKKSRSSDSKEESGGSGAEKRPREEVKMEEDEAEESGGVGNVPDLNIDFSGFDATQHVVEWKPEQANVFEECLRDIGPDFEQLARFTGHTVDQCKAQYVINEQVMSMMIRKAVVKKKGEVLGEWSEDEKNQMPALVETHGKDFEGIAAALVGNGKTKDMVEVFWNRYKWRLGLSAAYDAWEKKQERPTKAIKTEAEEDAVSGRKVLAETLDIRAPVVALDSAVKKEGE
jgi:hypothetical protein